jgi:hypothetical protein
MAPFTTAQHHFRRPEPSLSKALDLPVPNTTGLCFELCSRPITTAPFVHLHPFTCCTLETAYIFMLFIILAAVVFV